MDPPDRVPLLLRDAQVIQKNLVDEVDVRVELRASWLGCAAIAGWLRMLQHILDGAAINAIPTSNFPLAHPVLKNVNPNAPVQIQPVHPPPPARTETRDLHVALIYSGNREPGRPIQWPVIAPNFTV